MKVPLFEDIPHSHSTLLSYSRCYSIKLVSDLHCQSLPSPPNGKVILDILLHNLGHSHLEVLLRHMNPPLPQREHTRLRADRLALRPRRTRHLLSYLPQIDPPHKIHLARVDLQDLQTRLDGGVGELDLPVDTARSKQGRVQDVDTVGGHDDLDGLCGLEAVQLVQQFQHSPLHLRIPPLPLHTRTTNGIHLIDEDDARGMLSSHHEQLTHHTSTLPDVLLHQLRPRNTDEGAVCVVGDCSGQEGLACPWGTVHQHSLRLRDSQRFEYFGMFDGQFDDLLHLLDLLVEPTDHIVGRIWHFLHLHK